MDNTLLAGMMMSIGMIMELLLIMMRRIMMNNDDNNDHNYDRV